MCIHQKCTYIENWEQSFGRSIDRYCQHSPKFSFVLSPVLVADLPGSLFDTVLSGVLPPASLSHSEDLLIEMARILRPSGSLLLLEPVSLQGVCVFVYACVCGASGGRPGRVLGMSAWLKGG